jgi:putative phosphoribosyl transferase
MVFRTRTEAGRLLAQRLTGLPAEDCVVLGLPRGGVPVAFEVARALPARLDVIVVRKLGVPYQPELAMGAIGEGGIRVVNRRVQREAGVSDERLAAVEQAERVELDRRVHLLRAGRAPVPVAGRTAIVVDDGVATGATATAACQVARAMGASRVVLATPVASVHAARELTRSADQVVCVVISATFSAIGEFYVDFRQTTDAQVAVLLRDAGPAAAG